MVDNKAFIAFIHSRNLFIQLQLCATHGQCWVLSYLAVVCDRNVISMLFLITLNTMEPNRSHPSLLLVLQPVLPAFVGQISSPTSGMVKGQETVS